ncbi:MAG: hypothetical protein LBB21_02710 [Holosporaceae bacterium]|nr:hypothetical protein [Holosporaceae bacterium]
MKFKKIIGSTALALVLGITGVAIFTENVSATDVVPQSAGESVIPKEEKLRLIGKLKEIFPDTIVPQHSILNGELLISNFASRIRLSDQQILSALGTISEMTWITKLKLPAGVLTSLDWLKPLTKLEELSLGGFEKLESLTDIPQELKLLKKLRLVGSGITSLEGVERFDELEELDLSCCKNLENLRCAHSIHVSHGGLIGAQRGFRTVPNQSVPNQHLKKLNLSGTGIETLAGLERFENLTGLAVRDCIRYDRRRSERRSLIMGTK